MRRVTRNGLIIVAAASGAMGVTMPAYADSAADGGTANSPGVISGNSIQLPVHAPVNACGNTVNVAGLLNPTAGNSCANKGGGTEQRDSAAVADGSVGDSPGVLSGNDVQLPVHAPVNVSGNSVNVAGVGNAAVGNESTNESGSRPQGPADPGPQSSAPPRGHSPTQAQPPTQRHAAPEHAAALAHTGTDLTGPAVAASAALVVAGAVLYRRSRPAARR
ncbi:chaplin [Streptomyces sporangiiformans]|uniref:Chaplin n=1 Tax=Streptomyces sporangiiformans TaxID=2315329 RepID=A0A505DPN5_9ACTN|nr:chaplin [Streptomyces sporangiiformans]TPQ23183.1 chaplin [Streptomyces sporangiiformans]